MEDSANPVPAAKGWTDEIDDLYDEATARNLRAMRGPTRARVDPNGTEDLLGGAGSVRRGVGAGGSLQ